MISLDYISPWPRTSLNHLSAELHPSARVRPCSAGRSGGAFLRSWNSQRAWHGPDAGLGTDLAESAEGLQQTSGVSQPDGFGYEPSHSLVHRLPPRHPWSAPKRAVKQQEPSKGNDTWNEDRVASISSMQPGVDTILGKSQRRRKTVSDHCCER